MSVNIIRGETKTLDLSIIDGAGAAVDITGASIYMTVATDTGETPLIEKATGGSGITITDAAGGLAEVVIDAADTATLDIACYQYDVWLEFAGPVRHPVVKPAPFNVLASVKVFP